MSTSRGARRRGNCTIRQGGTEIGVVFVGVEGGGPPDERLGIGGESMIGTRDSRPWRMVGEQKSGGDGGVAE